MTGRITDDFPLEEPEPEVLTVQLALELDEQTEETPPTAVPGRDYFGMTGDPLRAGWLDDEDEVSLHGEDDVLGDDEVSLHGGYASLRGVDPEETLIRGIPAPVAPRVVPVRSIAVMADAQAQSGATVHWGALAAVVGGFVMLLGVALGVLLAMGLGL